MKREKIDRYRKYIPAVLIILILIAIGLRFYKLAFEDMWYDEAIDVHNACNPDLNQGLHDSIVSHHFPLHIFILHFWLKMFPFSIFWIRMPYAIIGALSIIAFFWLCKIIKQGDEQLFPYIATLLFGLSNNVLYYSQEARDFIYVVLLSILSFCLLLKHYYTGKIKYIVYYAICALLLLYANFFAVLILLTYNACYCYFYLTNKKRLSRVRNWILAQGAIILCYIPLFITAKNTLQSQFHRGLSEYMFISSSFKQLLLYYCYLLHSATFTPDITPDIFLRVILSFFSIFHIGINCYRLLKEKKNYFLKEDSLIFFMLVFWVVIPCLPLYIISELKTPILHYRYILTCTVPVLLLSVKGFFELPKKFMGALLLVLLLLYTMSYSHWFNVQKKGRYKSTFNYVYATSLKGNPIIFFNPGYLALPIFCNISTKEEISSSGMDIFEKLKHRDIYVYDPVLLDGIITQNKAIEFFALIDWVGAEDVEKDLNARSNLYNIDIKITNSFTIKHFIILKDMDKIIKHPLTDNIFQNDGIYCNKEYNTLHPEEYNKKSEIIYRFSSQNICADTILLNVQAYVIFMNNYIKIYCGNNLEEMDLLYQYQNNKIGQEIIMKTIDVSKYVKDNTGFYIKIELFTNKKYSKALWDSRIEKLNLILIG